MDAIEGLELLTKSLKFISDGDNSYEVSTGAEKNSFDVRPKSHNTLGPVSFNAGSRISVTEASSERVVFDISGVRYNLYYRPT